MDLQNGRIRATKACKKMTPRVLPPPTPPLGRQGRSVSLAAATASPALCGSAQGTLLCSSIQINGPVLQDASEEYQYVCKGDMFAALFCFIAVFLLHGLFRTCSGQF